MHHENKAFDEDEVYALMMDALDDEVTAEQQQTLESHLRTYPDLAREWEAMQAVEALFRQAPLVAPPVNFAVQTLAHLPNLRFRRVMTGVLYVLILFSGLLPFVAVMWILSLSGAFSAEPAFGNTLVELLSDAWQVGSVMLGALAQILVSMGDYVGQQPAILGLLFVMVGSIFLWGGVYQQLIREPQTV